MNERNQRVITKEQAENVCGQHPIPKPGYMRAVRVDDQCGWVRHLRCTGLFILSDCDSFHVGTGVGALRKMCC